MNKITTRAGKVRILTSGRTIIKPYCELPRI